MLPENNLTADEILAKLDKTSRKARIISLALTLLLLLILGIVVFLTYSTTKTVRKELGDLGNTRANLQTEINALEKDKEALINTRSKQANVIYASADCIENNSNCAEAKKILANAGSGISANPNPTATPFSQKTPNTANTTTNTQTSVKNSSWTVYVQIAEERQRTAAKQIIQKINGGDFRFPGIELVERRIGKTQVRYFHKEDETKAQNLAEQLKSAKIEAATIFTNLKAPDNLLEIWFANDAFDK